MENSKMLANAILCCFVMTSFLWWQVYPYYKSQMILLEAQQAKQTLQHVLLKFQCFLSNRNQCNNKTSVQAAALSPILGNYFVFILCKKCPEDVEDAKLRALRRSTSTQSSCQTPWWLISPLFFFIWLRKIYLCAVICTVAHQCHSNFAYISVLFFPYFQLFFVFSFFIVMVKL